MTAASLGWTPDTRSFRLLVPGSSIEETCANPLRCMSLRGDSLKHCRFDAESFQKAIRSGVQLVEATGCLSADAAAQPFHPKRFWKPLPSPQDIAITLILDILEIEQRDVTSNVC